MGSLDTFVGGISGVQVAPFDIDEPFIDFAGRFAHRPGTVLLLSGTDLDCARYHILGINPWLTLRMRGRQAVLSVEGKSLDLSEDPFYILNALIKKLRLPDNLTKNFSDPEASLPLAAGLLGYLSYDLKDVLEVLPRTAVDDLMLPDLYMVSPGVIFIHDKVRQATWQCIPQRPGAGDSYSIAALKERVGRRSRVQKPEGMFQGGSADARSGFTREGYMTAVKTIKDYISAGHVYQVNLSQRFMMDFQGDPYRFFCDLYCMNPAPFFAYIHAEDHYIISTSPERFVKQVARQVETRPIKGTRPRGRTLAEDDANRRDLLASKKDDAELSMIVDLLRNDIGKVCSAGSVRVSEHKRLEAYQNVYHLVSVVEGVLSAERNTVDLIRATFPGGSITGCPKIRAMEIIDELEPSCRHIYTGAIGYISFHDTMDLSIAIRTATVLNDKIIFSVGGGIVFDSDPADEYEETLHKGRTLMTVLSDASVTPPRRVPVAWVNGVFQSLADARVPVSDQGLLYGYGFFETIRTVNGRPRQLKAHLTRFDNTWRELFKTNPPDLSWRGVIEQVLDHNGLNHATAAVKILATRGDREVPPYTHRLIVTARAYEHRLAGKDAAGLRLAVYPEMRQTPLADHKTLNYLYYLLAGQWAREQGADEALILNADGSVSETNTAALLAIKGKTIVRPASCHVLPSVMQQRVCALMAGWGYDVESRQVTVPELSSFDEVFALNALMGAVPVLAVGSETMAPPSDRYRQINRQVL